ncbi:cathepsin S-like [Xenopus tropicalis]|uniref:Cathepsin S-like n=1 Tax=Xenopus tropicalis TaxID=8364 RepID=A0A8J1IPX8_XENTR|nr:cathepsin S-like [Xenopus tropicalis]
MNNYCIFWLSISFLYLVHQETMGPSSICLVALLSLLIPAHSAPDPTLDTHWQLWVKTHQKSYKDAEEERARRTIWEETLKFITVHNLEYSLGLHTYEVGMNHLGDMTGEEVAATMTGYIDSGDSLDNVVHVPKEILEALPPASIDWRTKDCVTPVRNQEAQCKRKKRSNTGVVMNFHKIPAGNETLLKNAVGTVGPVSVAIDSSHQGFRMHKSAGIYYDPYCTTNVDHAVLVVGYGTENGKDYWLVKNSWGIETGDKGYIKMARNRKNHCGIAQAAAYPILRSLVLTD